MKVGHCWHPKVPAALPPIQWLYLHLQTSTAMADRLFQEDHHPVVWSVFKPESLNCQHCYHHGLRFSLPMGHQNRSVKSSNCSRRPNKNQWLIVPSCSHIHHMDSSFITEKTCWPQPQNYLAHAVCSNGSSIPLYSSLNRVSVADQISTAIFLFNQIQFNIKNRNCSFTWLAHQVQVTWCSWQGNSKSANCKQSSLSPSSGFVIVCTLFHRVE